MAWDAGTITDAAPWAALSTKIKALCGGAGVENWEFVENIPAGTGAGQSGSASYSLDVFKCHGRNDPYTDVYPTNKLNASDTNAGAATSIVFAGVGALSANKVFTVSVINTKATAADDPTAVTLDGSNAPTFTKIASKIGGDATGIIKVTVWMGSSGGSAPTGTNLTVNYGANVPTAVIAIMDEWTGLDETLATTGIDASGATQVCVQAGNASGTAATAHTVTLAALLGAKSVIYQVAGQTAGSGNYNSGVASGWLSSLAAGTTVATPTAGARTQYKPDREEVVSTLTHSSSTAMTSWATIALELQRKQDSLAYATLNDAGNDWYFILEIPVADGAVNTSCEVTERYNSGAKAFSSMAPAAGANPVVGTGYWRTFGFFAYASVTGNNRTNTTHQALNTSGFNYWIKMTKNAILFATKVGTAEMTNGAMLLDSFVTNVPDSLPLMNFKSMIAASAYLTFTSLPGCPTPVTGYGWAIEIYPWTYPVVTAQTNNSANAVDLWASNKIHVSRLAIFHAEGNIGNTPKCGLLRGLMKSDFLCCATGGTVNRGDTMVIGGNTWTVIATGFFGTSGSPSLKLFVRAN